ncbi:MAG: hypothetical protein M0R17_00950 [Candidatus Omnitrophica bacterium]|jgi:hypothetical protein|nr:hypothetical protein [Candidatus Omnitrophota bacterium]
MTCRFDAVAAGYASKAYSVNLILDDNNLYNADGSSGHNRKAIYANGGAFSFDIFDGNEYRGLRSDYGLRYGIPATWTLNTGEVTCTISHGWSDDYYQDGFKTKYLHDTIVKVDSIYVYGGAKKVYIHDTLIKIDSVVNSLVKVDTICAHDTVFKIDTVIKVDKISPSWVSCNSVLGVDKIKYDTITKVVHDTFVNNGVLDSSKATQRFSLHGKYAGLAANEIDCEFYAHFLKYNDTVFNDQGEYSDSFEIKLLYTSGSYYKTIKIERHTLISLVGHPAIYPTRKGNFYITTERNWNEDSEKDWSKVKPSAELQKEVTQLRAEIDKK